MWLQKVNVEGKGGHQGVWEAEARCVRSGEEFDGKD